MSEAGSRKSLSYITVAVGFFSLMALGMGVGLFIYYRYVAYERVAALHIPGNSTWAVRVDVGKVVLFEPVRKHFFPLLDETNAHPKLASRRERLAQFTGIELGRDLREIVWASGPAENDWLLVVGGKFPQDVVPGLVDVLLEEGQRWTFDSDRERLTAPNGIEIAQASDGALLVASNRARLESALPRQTGYQSLGIPADQAGGFGVAKTFFSGPLTSLCGSAVTLPSGIDKIERVSGSFRLGETIEIDSVVRLSPGTEAAAFIPQLRAALGLFGRLAPVGTADRPLGRAQVRERAPNAVEVTQSWDRTEIDTLASNIADALKAWLKAETRAPTNPRQGL